MLARIQQFPKTSRSHFAAGPLRFLHGSGSPERRFERFRDVVAGLPRKLPRVLTWHRAQAQPIYMRQSRIEQ